MTLDLANFEVEARSAIRSSWYNRESAAISSSCIHFFRFHLVREIIRSNNSLFFQVINNILHITSKPP